MSGHEITRNNSFGVLKPDEHLRWYRQQDTVLKSLSFWLALSSSFYYKLILPRAKFPFWAEERQSFGTQCIWILFQRSNKNKKAKIRQIKNETSEIHPQNSLQPNDFGCVSMHAKEFNTEADNTGIGAKKNWRSRAYLQISTKIIFRNCMGNCVQWPMNTPSNKTERTEKNEQLTNIDWFHSTGNSHENETPECQTHQRHRGKAIDSFRRSSHQSDVINA